MPGWGQAQWRLLLRDAVVFGEVVAVGAALVDTRLVERVGRQVQHGLMQAAPDAGSRPDQEAAMGG